MLIPFSDTYPICPSPTVARLESRRPSPCLSQSTRRWSRRWGGRPWISAVSSWAPGSPVTITSTGGPIRFSKAGGKQEAKEGHQLFLP